MYGPFAICAKNEWR